MGKNLLLTFNSRIQSHYPAFTKTERRIANYILQNPEYVMTATSAQIAEEIGVSPASVIRLSKRCGFSGLAELKLELKKEYYTVNIEKQVGDIQADDSLAMIKQKIMGYHISVSSDILSAWNEEAYLHAVNELLAAKNILVTSYGGSKAMAVCLVDLLLQLGLPCEMWEDSSFNALRIGNMGPGDVVVTFNYTGRYIDTIRYLKLAKEREIITIGITGYMDSPMIPYTDIVLSACMEENSYQWSTLGSRIAELAVVEVLYSLLAAKLDYKAEEFQEMNTILEQWRVPDQDN